MPDLLIELFSEEIPARMQQKAAADLKRLMTDGLVEAGLTYSGASAFATPRRLALTLQGLTAESPTLREDRRGPKVGAPEQAIEGFLRGAGVTRDALQEREDKKGRFWYATVTTPGRPAEAILAELLEKTVRTFPWPKSMRWGTGSLRWVRPLHRILCILTDESGSRVVPLEIDGIRAGRTTEGHRFMAPAAFDVTSFDDYASKLRAAKVLLEPELRAEHILHEAGTMAFAQALELVGDDGLLQEVAGLVEWPEVLMGAIEARFLSLPPEVLQTSMKAHQKFFSVRNPKTGRIEKFVTVANIETADNGATILAGNQKVLAARLSDAAFFWQNDLRVAKGPGLKAWTDRLETVTFHNKLGSQGARIARIAALAEEIAPMVGADPALARQAAEVAKADLSSEMVYEFPELQGLMGRYYAQAAGLSAEVAAACQEHYSPLGPSDTVPTAPVSVAVALADKLDTLTGFWAIDEKPTGSKDPYALRRAALGVIRLVLGNGLRVGLRIVASPRFDAWIVDMARANHIQGLQIPAEAKLELSPDSSKQYSRTHSFYRDFPTMRDFDEDAFITCFNGGYLYRTIAFATAKDLSEFEKYRCTAGRMVDDILAFIHDRLKVHLRDEGIRHDVIDACLAMPGNDDLTLLVRRAEALSGFLKTEDGTNLLQGFRRANNILTQAEEKDGVEYSYGADPKFAEDPAETALFAALDAADARIAPAMADEDFSAAMAAMAALRAPIDAFFEAVQVNADNQILRRNRLNLLSRIRKTCLQVADLTRLEG